MSRRRGWKRWKHLAKPPLLVAGFWGIGLVLGLAVLIGLAYLIGHGPPKSPDGLRSVLSTLSKPSVSLPIAFLVIVQMAWCMRRITFEYLAWKPGPIEVMPFSTATDLAPAQIEQLTLIFRRRLSELRLQAANSVPGAATQGDFLDVLGSGGIDARNFLGSLVTLLRAGRPTHAYMVSGVLLKRSGPLGCGATIQVVRLPNRARVPVTVWDGSWDSAIRRAADSATAAILPNTQHCRDQWITWRRLVMPEGLLHDYEEGARLEQKRRYDEALDAYYRALMRDPMNLSLRLQIGKLQEKLGLYLDALSTYEGIGDVAMPGGKRASRRLYVRKARKERKRAARVAEYRRIILMGGAELTNQWRMAGNVTARDREREALRSALEKKVKSELKDAVRRHTDPRSVPLGRKRRRVGDKRIGDLLAVTAASDRAELLQLRELFALAALDAARSLRRQARRDRFGTLGVHSIKLTELCIQERLDWVQHKLAKEAKLPTGSIEGQTRFGPWPPSVDELRDAVGKIEHRTKFHSWPEHYNAACAFAIPMLADEVDDEERKELARLAIDRLKRASSYADADILAARRDWLIAEDPDLNGLRTHPKFKEFEAMYFPAARATPPRPRQVQTLESSRHVQALLAQTAALWKAEWHRRGRCLERRPDIHQLLRWWRDEQEAWRLVRSVAVDYRHWQTRLRLIRHVAACRELYPVPALQVPFPRYEEQPVHGGDENKNSQDEIELANARLDSLATHLAELPREGEPHTMLQDLEKWQARLEQLDLSGEDPRRYFLAKVCDHHAGLWQILQQWVQPSAAWQDAEQREKLDTAVANQFGKQVEEARQLWSTAYAWWRPSTLIAALASPRGRQGVPPRRVLVWSAGEWWRERAAQRGGQAEGENGSAQAAVSQM